MIFTIITTIVAITVFILTFGKMIKNNSGNYLYVLGIEFIGIVIGFISIILKKEISGIESVVIYVLCVIIPVVMFVLQSKDIDLIQNIKIFFMLKGNKDIKEELIKTTEKYPNNYLAHKKLAEYYEKNHEIEKAEDEYMKMIRINEDDYETYCKLAELCHTNKKEDDAISVLQMLLKNNPEYYKGSILLGDILYENEKFKEAIIVYNEALKYNPAEYDLYYHLGMTYTRLNDFQSANECYKKAATLNSLTDISNLNLGQIHLIFKEYDKAAKYFYEVINSEDEKISANAYYHLAKIKILQKDENQAIQYANIAIETYPKIIRRMEKDDIFMLILGKIDLNKLEKKKGEEIESNITDKEEKIIEYLGKTFNVVETLTNNTISHQEIKKDRENNIM